MPDNFRANLARRVPVWLGREWGAKLVGAIGLHADAVMVSLIAAAKQHLVTSRDQADDSMLLAGRDRQMRKWPSETYAAYQLRLREAWPTWQSAGSFGTLRAQLRLSVAAATAELYRFGEWQRGSRKSRFFFWIPQGVAPNKTPAWGDSARKWGDGRAWGDGWLWADGLRKWGDGWVWGSGLTYEQVGDLRAASKTWKQAQWTGEAVIEETDGFTWGATMTWGSFTWTDDNNGVVALK